MASRLHRLIRIIRAVRSKSYPSVLDLCNKLQVKERTLFNDLKELKELLGIDIQFDRNRRGYFLESSDADISLLALTDETAILLILSFGLLTMHGENIAKPLKEFFDDEIGYSLNLARSDVSVLPELLKGIDLKTNIDKDMIVEICRACLLRSKLQVSLVTGGDALLVYPSYLVYSTTDWKLSYTLNGTDNEAQREMPLSCIERIESPV